VQPLHTQASTLYCHQRLMASAHTGSVTLHVVLGQHFLPEHLPAEAMVSHSVCCCLPCRASVVHQSWMLMACAARQALWMSVGYVTVTAPAAVCTCACCCRCRRAQISAAQACSHPMRVGWRILPAHSLYHGYRHHCSRSYRVLLPQQQQQHQQQQRCSLQVSPLLGRH
jgi:hypothetical protein